MDAEPGLIEAREVVAGYRRRRKPVPIVEAHSLEARPGQFTAVVGPNGAGKSTLLRTLVGSQPPLGGEVLLDGAPLGRMTPVARARKLAVVLTDRVDVGLLSVGEVVALGRHPHSGWCGWLSDNDREVARRSADLVGIGQLWGMQFAHLSDGQRQRVMLARALAQEPKLLVLDEPTAFLDVPAQIQLTDLLVKLAAGGGLAILLTTHDLDLALRHADDLWLIDRGRVTVGNPPDLVASGQWAAALDGGDPSLRGELTRRAERYLGPRTEMVKGCLTDS